MAATYFDITVLPKSTIAGFQHWFFVTARNADGTVDTGFTGTVVFTSTDLTAALPANYTFVGGDNGKHRFPVRFKTLGAQTMKVTSGLLVGNARTTVGLTPPGWGLDDEGILPFGDAVAGIGSALLKAEAFSTHEVDVTVTNPVQDNSAFVPGDALNPGTWSIQRLDNADFLDVVQVTQVGPFTYRLLSFEAFGDVSVTHRVHSDTLLDTSGVVITSPRNADFLGLLEAAKSSVSNIMATRKVISRDIANSQIPGFAEFAATLQIGGNGDYKNVSGPELTRKLIFRRLISTPGDFFHLPASGPNAYGVGLRVKAPLPAQQLIKLRALIQQQVLREPSVASASVQLTFDPSRNYLNLKVTAVDKVTGQPVTIGLKANENGVQL